MRLAVFGLGYVGCVTAASLARRGHTVVGVDLNLGKLRDLERGRAPVAEPGLDELVSEVVSARWLRAEPDPDAAVAASDVSLVCVGTPSAPDGRLDTAALERVAGEIGRAIGRLGRYHLVVVRSTTLPGTCRRLVIPILEEASGCSAGTEFGFAVNPEFMREGSSITDFEDPPKTVVGELNPASGEAVIALYDGFAAPAFRVSIEVAEMAKYADNAFHALKVGFANEIGAACRAFALDSHEVMAILLADTKLNLSPAYLSPGFAFGGSCLGKDLRALVHAGRDAGVELPILGSVLDSNELCIRHAVDLVLASGRRRVGLFGLAFKPGTDDLRESPLVELAAQLLEAGLDVLIFDPSVRIGALTGTNRAAAARISSLEERLVADAEAVMRHAEVCVVGASTPASVAALAARDGRVVVDLVRLPNARNLRAEPGYVGIAW